MSDSNGWKFNRRGVLKSSMAVLGGGLLSRYSLEKAAADPNSSTEIIDVALWALSFDSRSRKGHPLFPISVERGVASPKPQPRP